MEGSRPRIPTRGRMRIADATTDATETSEPPGPMGLLDRPAGGTYSERYATCWVSWVAIRIGSLQGSVS